MQTTTANINAIASTEVLRRLETPVLLELHDKITLPGLLANAESWNLSKNEYDQVEQIEIQSVKYLFDLPLHLSTPAIIHSFGLLYTSLRIEKQCLTYLHRILKRTQTHWTAKTLKILECHNLGWYKSIMNTLRTLDLPTELDAI